MKYKLIVLTVFAFAIHFSYSQQKNYLSLYIGGSIPVGSYAGTDFSNPSDGFAKLGELMNISFSHKLNKHLSLTAMLYGQRNGINTSKLESGISQTYFFGDFNDIGPRQYGHWVVNKKSWYAESIQVGLSEEMALSADNKISFIASALAGLAYGQIPKMQAQSYSDTSYAILVQSGASAFGFSYSLNAGIKYALNKKLSLLFNAGYFGTAKINFKNISDGIVATNGGLVVPGVYSLSNSSYPIITDYGGGSFNQTISSINISAGIGLKL
jgi:hypothetical protein